MTKGDPVAAPVATITLNVSNGATTLDVASVAISMNGNKLDHAVEEGSWTRAFSIATQEGKTYSITAAASGLESGAEYSVTATFKDSAGETTTLESSFSTPALYTQGYSAPASAAGLHLSP